MKMFMDSESVNAIRKVTVHNSGGNDRNVPLCASHSNLWSSYITSRPPRTYTVKPCQARGSFWIHPLLRAIHDCCAGPCAITGGMNSEMHCLSQHRAVPRGQRKCAREATRCPDDCLYLCTIVRIRSLTCGGHRYCLRQEDLGVLIVPDKGHPLGTPYLPWQSMPWRALPPRHNSP